MILPLSGCAQWGSSLRSSLNSSARLKARSFQLETRWIQATMDRNYLGFRRSHRMTPLIRSQMIIQGNGLDGIAAYDRERGHELWKFPVTDGVEGGAAERQGRLYFGGGDGSFYALETSSGRELWTFQVNSQVLSAPVATAEAVYFVSGNNTVFALDARSGKQKWLYKRALTAPLSVRGASRPTVVGSTLYVGTSDGYLVALDRKDGQLFWERRLSEGRFTDIDATPIVYKNHIYVSGYDGSLFCLSRSAGQILWKLEKGSAHAVTLVKDRLYMSTSDNHIMAVNRKTGAILWSRKNAQGMATQPKYFRGLLIFGESQGALRVIDADNGQDVKSFVPGRGLSASPKVSRSGEIFFISNEGNLYALRAGWF